MPSTYWDTLWTNPSTGGGIPLDAPSLDNDIDQGKMEFLLPHMGGGGRAIEIGCGSARLLARLGLAAAYQLTAADTSVEALKRAMETASLAGRAIHVTCADALELPFRSGSFDVVLSGGLLEHFRDPAPILAEMVRLLRSGGIFYADVVPRKFSLFRIREVRRIVQSEWLMPGVYESTFDGKYYSRELTSLGCTDVVWEYRGVYPPYLSRRLQKITRNCDGTWLASVLGWYFVLRGRKR